MQQNFQQPQMSAEQVFSQSTGITCDGCGSMFFEASVIFRKVSKIVTGTPNDQLVPIMAYRCQDCLQPLVETLPPQLIDELVRAEGDGDVDEDTDTDSGIIVGLNK